MGLLSSMYPYLLLQYYMHTIFACVVCYCEMTMKSGLFIIR